MSFWHEITDPRHIEIYDDDIISIRYKSDNQGNHYIYFKRDMIENALTETADAKYLWDACHALYEKYRSENELPDEVDDWDAEEFLNSKDIYDHPMISDRLNNNGYEVASLIAEFYNKRISKAKG